MSNMLDEQQLHETLYDYFESKEWWMFLCGWQSDRATNRMQKLEEKYFTPGTPKNGDFHLYLAPRQGEIFAAKKTRVTLEQLKEIFPEMVNQTAEQDVIGLLSKDSDGDKKFYNSIMNGLKTVRQIRTGH